MAAPAVSLHPAYFGGFFDGDGSARFIKNSFLVDFGQVLKDRSMLDLMAAKYGGSVLLVNKETEAQQEFWKYSCYGDRARAFAEDVRPYVLKSRKAAEIDAALARLPDAGKFIASHRHDDDAPVDLAGRDPADLDAYFAGFVLADGCVAFKGRCPILNVKQNKRAVLDAMVAHFGLGKVSPDGACWQFMVSGSNARAVAARLVARMHDCGKRTILAAFETSATADPAALSALARGEHGGKQSAKIRAAIMNGTIYEKIFEGVHVGYQACLADYASKTFSDASKPMAVLLAEAEAWLKEARAPYRAAGIEAGVDPKRLEAADAKAEEAKLARAEKEVAGRAGRAAAIAARDAARIKKAAEKKATRGGHVVKYRVKGVHVGYVGGFNGKSKTFTAKTLTLEEKLIAAEAWVVGERLIYAAEQAEKEMVEME